LSRGTRLPLLQWATPPNLELAFQIEDLTEGAVPARYWLEISEHSKD
jgi:hypothetical protein